MNAEIGSLTPPLQIKKCGIQQYPQFTLCRDEFVWSMKASCRVETLQDSPPVQCSHQLLHTDHVEAYQYPCVPRVSFYNILHCDSYGLFIFFLVIMYRHKASTCPFPPCLSFPFPPFLTSNPPSGFPPVQSPPRLTGTANTPLEAGRSVQPKQQALLLRRRPSQTKRHRPQ